MIRRHAYELLSRQDTKNILDRAAEDNPKLIEDLVPKLLSMAIVQKVLQNMLRERVSIRDSVTILEALGEGAAMTKNPILLTEYVRQAIRRMLVKPYLNPNGDLPAFFVDSQIEQAIETSVEFNEHARPHELAAAKNSRHSRPSDALGGIDGFAHGRRDQLIRALFPAADRSKGTIPNLSDPFS